MAPIIGAWDRSPQHFRFRRDAPGKWGTALASAGAGWITDLEQLDRMIGRPD
ncbi:hypothetical protein [Streptomyces sp. KR55]|uniref:hypothetical protein n=1 Tax=Streptomyces sp. KR55 TaxID=3457425 RepID=UPI003FD493DB